MRLSNGISAMPKARPLVLGERKKPLCVSLTPSTIDTLQSLAERNRMSTSMYLELLLRDLWQTPSNSDS